MIELKPIDKRHCESIRQWAQEKEYEEYFRRFPPAFLWDSNEITLKLFVPNSFAIHYKGIFVGLATIANDNQQDRIAEIGTMVIPSADRLSFAKEALTQLVNYIFKFKGYNKVTCTFLPHREDIKRVLSENGFKQDALFRENCWWNGAFYDELQYSLLKKDWK